MSYSVSQKIAGQFLFLAIEVESTCFFSVLAGSENGENGYNSGFDQFKAPFK